MEALNQVYQSVHPDIQADIDYYVKNRGEIIDECPYMEPCRIHTFSRLDWWYKKVFVFSKAHLFKRDPDSNTCPLYHGGLGCGVYHRILFNLNTKMYMFQDDWSDDRGYITTFESTDWLQFCEKIAQNWDKYGNKEKITNTKLRIA